MTIPDYVPDEWVTEAARKAVSEPRRAPIDPLAAVTWWVVIPVGLVAFWAVVVGLIWLAA